ncbi:hypothetical protein TWF970_007068 [Orbilia oligospora]|uniref:Uncharacterized protein n=1 Tax=Orbilia oligospora TaxID=2813651 RepID=A0A7C8RJU2_ORBOL|nr:hypothetical protein TWF970_007068 [Orbilia oligospora]
MASNGRPLPFSCLSILSPPDLSPYNWELVLCNEVFETVATLPGFTITALETTDFLYLALNIWINTAFRYRSLDPVAVHSLVQCIQTVIRHHSRFNINPFVVSRWALYTTVLAYDEHSEVDIFTELFEALSNVDLYPAEGILKTDASKQKKQEILLSWLINSRTDPGDDNRFMGLRRDSIDINWLRFWLDNGVDPNRAGSWGTLSHFITGLFLGDFGLQINKSSRLSVSKVDEYRSRAKRCLVLLKSYNADSNLRHPITHETILEYACRLYTSPQRTVGFIKALIDFAPPITITKYALISAFHLDKRHAAQERHGEFPGVGEQPPKRLSDLLASELKHEHFAETASRDRLGLGSLENALEILEKGLVAKDWDEFYDFYAKGVELPEDLPFEFLTRHISKTIPENLYTFKRTSGELDLIDPFHVSASHLTEKKPFDQLFFMIKGRQAKIVHKYISCYTYDKGAIDEAAFFFGSLKDIE